MLRQSAFDLCPVWRTLQVRLGSHRSHWRDSSTFSVCVVGSGPAGFYTTAQVPDSLLRSPGVKSDGCPAPRPTLLFVWKEFVSLSLDAVFPGCVAQSRGAFTADSFAFNSFCQSAAFEEELCMFRRKDRAQCSLSCPFQFEKKLLEAALCFGRFSDGVATGQKSTSW